MTETKFTPEPWLDENGEWLYDPHDLLTDTANAWVMGTAPDLYAALERFAGLFTPEVIADFDRAGILNSIILDVVLLEAHVALKKARGEVQP